jgi:UDP-N-acetylglucosamine:LPS N-acetylglucosamine transferase
LPLCSSHIRLHNHLSAAALNTVICQSAFVISRSGYSTIMDLTGLGKKSILIPTPGQPEQEYLAEYLFNKKIALRIKQRDFILPAALEAAKKFPFVKYEHTDQDMLSNAVEELLRDIKQH